MYCTIAVPPFGLSPQRTTRPQTPVWTRPTSPYTRSSSEHINIDIDDDDAYQYKPKHTRRIGQPVLELNTRLGNLQDDEIEDSRH